MRFLRWMLENDITDVLDLTFAEETDYFGRKSVVELRAGGKDIKVGGLAAGCPAGVVGAPRMSISGEAQGRGARASAGVWGARRHLLAPAWHPHAHPSAPPS